jgi:hypothetical protein
MIPSCVRLAIAAFGWGFAWAALGAMLSVVAGTVDPAGSGGSAGLARTLGSVGALCGITYGLLIALLEPGKTFRQIPLFRAALWGTFAGTVPPLVLASIHDSILANTCPLSMTSALVTVLVARAPRSLARKSSAPAKVWFRPGGEE